MISSCLGTITDRHDALEISGVGLSRMAVNAIIHNNLAANPQAAAIERIFRSLKVKMYTYYALLAAFDVVILGLFALGNFLGTGEELTLLGNSAMSVHFYLCFKLLDLLLYELKSVKASTSKKLEELHRQLHPSDSKKKSSGLSNKSKSSKSQSNGLSFSWLGHLSMRSSGEQQGIPSSAGSYPTRKKGFTKLWMAGKREDVRSGASGHNDGLSDVAAITSPSGILSSVPEVVEEVALQLEAGPINDKDIFQYSNMLNDERSEFHSTKEK